MITIRFANDADGPALSHMDSVTQTTTTSPADVRAADSDRPFFRGDTKPEDVIVADDSGNAVGYVALEKPTPLASNTHVLMVGGLAVAPGHQNTGIGKLLIDAAVRESERRGARKLSLRVLDTNPEAQRLYEKCGFTTEGVLREEFFLDGRYVDDILMARKVGRADAAKAGL